MGSVNQNYHQDFLDHYLIRYKYVYITFNIIIILIILVIVIYSSELSKPVISSVILFICICSSQQLSFGGRADVQRNPSSVVITTVIPASIIITPLENPPISECNILVKNVRLLFCVEFVVSRVSIYVHIANGGLKSIKPLWATTSNWTTIMVGNIPEQYQAQFENFLGFVYILHYRWMEDFCGVWVDNWVDIWRK